jgi:uncharacterized protein YgiM (DUF1202 family)
MNCKTKNNMRAISVVLVLFLTVAVFGVLSYFDGEELHGAASTGVVSEGPLNVRSGPGTNYSQYGMLSKGTSISITGTKTGSDGKEWLQILYQGKTGYVSAQYVMVKSTDPSSPGGDQGAISSGSVAADLLNVRKDAGTNFISIGTLSKGSVVSITGSKMGSDGKEWLQISYQGKTGYVSAQYVMVKSTDPSSPGGNQGAISSGSVAADLLNVRKDAGTNFISIGTLSKGSVVSITGSKMGSDGKEWLQILYQGKTGYVSAQHVISSSFALSSNTTKPNDIQKGSSFVLRGSISSKYRMNNVVIGVKSSSGTWITGKYVSVNPNATSYDIARADAAIKFGTLAEGRYYYCIYAKDVNGYSKTLLNHPFSVKGTTPPTLVTGEMGTTLSYRTSVITNIGKQPYSGPCGIYAMAYSRAILDGSFTRGKYAKIHDRIIAEYGNGTNYAHWWKAGGSSVYHTTNSSCYREVYKQINMGKPCIILVRNGYTGNTHFVTVIGYTKGTTASNVNLGRLIAIDPAYGVVKYLGNMRYYDHPDAQIIKF